ncbi:MAG: hypothetical protein AAFV78_15090 [Bacteroidota bacterium]
MHAKVLATKHFLNKEIVRNKKSSNEAMLTFREIGVRMDMIHEAERKGVRNLDERENRKLTRMISELERLANISLN